MACPIPHSLPLVLQEMVRVPEHVALDGDSLVWEWGAADWALCGDALGPFTMLAGGELGQPSGRAVLRLAERYGPLYPRPEPVDGGDAGPWRESLEDWRKQAEAVRGAAELARKLGDGDTLSRSDLLELIPEPEQPPLGGWGQWLIAEMTKSEPADVPGLIETGRPWAEYDEWRRRQVFWFDDKPHPVERSSEERARGYVQACVEGLLYLAHARLHIGWHHGEGPRISLLGRTFLAVVAGQLICAAYGGQIAVCHACGAVITSGRRRPAGQRAFCDQECRAAFNKLHKRQERARRRE